MEELKDTPILDHVPTTEELLSLYSDIQKENPISLNYKRVLIRPKIYLIKTFFKVFLSLLSASIIGVLLQLLFKNIILSTLIPILILIVFFIIRIKYISIWCIKCYQRFAPAKIRNKCRFEPSCSEYMIKSIEKYGFRKGFPKGLKRWKRCCPPNGGYDEP